MSEENEKKERKVSDMTDEEKEKLLEDAGLGSPFSNVTQQIKNLAPRIPSLQNFSSIPEATGINSSFDNSPKREIEMSESEEKKVEEALDYFETNSLYEEEFLKIFEDWQSDRTKSIKKFLLSLISVLSLTVFAGINILEVRLFNITVAEGYQSLFLSTFICVIAGLFYYYEVNLWRDKKVNDSNLKVFMESLQRSDQYLKEIDQVINKTGSTIEQLVEDFDDNSLVVQNKSSPLRGYRLMKFYKNDLEEPHTTDLKIYRFEITGLYFLGLLSILTIVRSMIWVSDPDAGLVLYYIICGGIIGSIIAFLQLRFSE